MLMKGVNHRLILRTRINRKLASTGFVTSLGDFYMVIQAITKGIFMRKDVEICMVKV